MRRVRLQISLRMLLLLVVMFAVLFSWIGVRREMRRNRLETEIRRLEIWRNFAVQKIDDPQYGFSWRQNLRDTDTEIAARRDQL
jgi:uncharacterized membrane protein